MKYTIFFDLGNVLLYFDHQKMFRQVADYCSLDFEQVQNLMLKYSDAYERGEVDSQFMYEEISRHASKKLDFNPLMHAVSDIFQPNEAVISIAQQLKEQGHRLFILSNTCDAHFTFASTHFPFLKVFDGYILSYQVGARKPEKEIYEQALNIANCPHHKCFYTDDILAYIEAARSLNIDAEQYKTPHDLIQHLNTRGIL
jgi:FMN phosphatase YigB (HAD superfamily)